MRALILLAFVMQIGCSTYSRDYRVEQVISVGDQLHVIVGAGTSASSIEGGRTSFSDRRYYLLTYDASAAACPPIHPSQVLDVSIGLGPLTLDPGKRIDFLIGAYPDRVIRVVSDFIHNRYEQRVAVLGHDPKSGRWGILRSWTFYDAGGGLAVYPASIDGRYVVFGNPLHVLDTASLAEVSPDDILKMVKDQYAQAFAWRDWQTRSAEFETGAISSLGPIRFGREEAAFYAWDAEKHEPIRMAAANEPACEGLVVLGRSHGGRSLFKAFDIASPMRAKGFTELRR